MQHQVLRTWPKTYGREYAVLRTWPKSYGKISCFHLKGCCLCRETKRTSDITRPEVSTHTLVLFSVQINSALNFQIFQDITLASWKEVEKNSKAETPAISSFIHFEEHIIIIMGWIDYSLHQVDRLQFSSGRQIAVFIRQIDCSLYQVDKL